jgi:signal transduction histidine kinase
VVEYAAATERLDRARAAVVSARHDERRVLRRELHDGIGPALAGIGFGLAAAQNLASQDPAQAGALVRRLTEDLRERIGDIDLVASGLPGTPVDVGESLRSLVAGFGEAGPRIDLDADDASSLAEAHRRPALLIAAEALHNAVRHAAASVIEIVVRAEHDGMVLEVTDDGCGLPPEPAGGVGFASMHERAAAVGGSLSVSPRAGGGTVVRCRFPMTKEVAV